MISYSLLDEQIHRIFSGVIKNMNQNSLISQRLKFLLSRQIWCVAAYKYDWHFRL